MSSDPFPDWVSALEARHLTALTFPEVRRALQALSSLYVERRERLASGAALGGAGKRAAFALYYGPIHFLLVQKIVRALGPETGSPRRILDLGCGTAAAGAAWALESGATIEGWDTSGWATAEARWTIARFGLAGEVHRGDLLGVPWPRSMVGVLLAFAVNEIDSSKRDRLLDRLLDAPRRGHQVLVIEPLARTASPWWADWREAFRAKGGREDIWRFRLDVPEVVWRLARAAGLDPRETGGRTLFLAGAPASGDKRHSSPQEHRLRRTARPGARPGGLPEIK